ncbi:MAG: hypothetical protein ACLU1W_09565 [Collinsella sp.]
MSHESDIVVATTHKDNRLVGMRLGNAVDGLSITGMVSISTLGV